MAHVISKNGKKMTHVATRVITPIKDTTPKNISLPAKQQKRRAENEEYLKNKNVKAFLDTIAASEGGDYHAKFGYGWAPGYRTGKWTFSDESTHPGAGYGGSTTASGRYQITKGSWGEYGGTKMGLSDFTPHTQDLIAVEMLRSKNAIDSIVNGDIRNSIHQAASQWESLPLGPGMANRPVNGHPSGQPYMPYDDVVSTYKELGGTVK